MNLPIGRGAGRGQVGLEEDDPVHVVFGSWGNGIMLHRGEYWKGKG